MKTINCGIFYEWGYDDDFMSILSRKFEDRNVRYVIYKPGDFPTVLHELKKNNLSFGSVIDRASDVDENCEGIMRILKRRGTFILNDPDRILRASDKATMHLEFITGGLDVPYTIIISPYNSEHEITLSLGELAKLGRPFIIKPANTTGGGIGVVTGAEGLQEVVETRQHNKDDKYLLQEKVQPLFFNGRRAWFRSFYVFGKVLTSWWDDLSHLYFVVTEEEEKMLSLYPIEEIVRKIHDICGLDFFSTEIALTAGTRIFTEGVGEEKNPKTDNQKFVVIDYVNEMCDMRLKSKHYDGVPDEIVSEVADQISAGIRRLIGHS